MPDDDDVIRPDAIGNVGGELRDKKSARVDIPRYRAADLRIAGDAGNSGVESVEQLCTKAGSLCFVTADCIGQFGRSELAIASDSITHQSR